MRMPQPRLQHAATRSNHARRQSLAIRRNSDLAVTRVPHLAPGFEREAIKEKIFGLASSAQLAGPVPKVRVKAQSDASPCAWFDRGLRIPLGAGRAEARHGLLLAPGLIQFRRLLRSDCLLFPITHLVGLNLFLRGFLLH